MTFHSCNYGQHYLLHKGNDVISVARKNVACEVCLHGQYTNVHLVAINTSHSQMLGKFEYTLPAKF